MRRGGLLLALLAPAALSAQPLPAWPTGLYSDVTSSQQTGDLGGLEVRFYSDGGRPSSAARPVTCGA